MPENMPGSFLLLSSHCCSNIGITHVNVSHRCGDRSVSRKPLHNDERQHFHPLSDPRMPEIIWDEAGHA